MKRRKKGLRHSESFIFYGDETGRANFGIYRNTRRSRKSLIGGMFERKNKENNKERNREAETERREMRKGGNY